jgi:hypothetical protein
VAPTSTENTPTFSFTLSTPTSSSHSTTSGGTTIPSIVTTSTQPAQSGTGPSLTSSAIGVRERAEVMSILFGMCFAVVVLSLS